jgi:hypothetical protein
VDTKGIFAVQQLHLGHVSKSFGLLENPKAIRNHDDVIAKIMNGAYSRANMAAVQEQRNRKLTREDRDKKYALSNQQNDKKGGGGGGGARKGDSRGARDKAERDTHGEDERPLKRPTFEGRDKSLQKPKKVGSKKTLAASGNFRKSSGGYFRKKLREQHTAEFSN